MYGNGSHVLTCFSILANHNCNDCRYNYADNQYNKSNHPSNNHNNCHHCTYHWYCRVLFIIVYEHSVFLVVLCARLHTPTCTMLCVRLWPWYIVVTFLVLVIPCLFSDIYFQLRLYHDCHTVC